MPRLKNAVPKYRRHKASGQAVVTIAGADHYLGKFNSKPSRMLYDRLVGEWLASGRQGPPPSPEDLTVTELIARFWKHAKAFYRHADGTPTETADNMRPALRELRRVYGTVTVDEFGPIALKAMQQRFIELGNSRRYVNDNIDRIRRMFRWGVSEELVDESTLRRLQTVAGLRKGKSAAVEHPPVPPVDDSVVDRTLPQLPAVVRAMVQIQRFTGARPGEVSIMRPNDIDRSKEVWMFIPKRHKTEHHGKSRAIAIGPRAQQILSPYMDRDPMDYCFKVSESVDEHLAERHKKRVTPLSCGCKPKKGKRKRKFNDNYTDDAYRRAIHRACDRAFPPPPPLAQKPGESNAARMRRLSLEQKEELKRWQSSQRWSPNQLRHTMGTQTRKQFGVEGVAAALGHSRISTSEIYAERNLDLASQIATELG